MNDLLLSSNGSGKLSSTVKGLLIYLVPLALMIAEKNGIKIEQNDVLSIIDSVSLIIATGTTVFGLGRKIYFAVKNRLK